MRLNLRSGLIITTDSVYIDLWANTRSRWLGALGGTDCTVVENAACMRITESNYYGRVKLPTRGFE